MKADEKDKSECELTVANALIRAHSVVHREFIGGWINGRTDGWMFDE